MKNVPAVVVGAGPTGLSAAYHLAHAAGGDAVLLLEQNRRVGGWCRSINDRGFTFDFAGHIMFSDQPYVLDLYGKLLGHNLHWQEREAWIYSKKVYTRYPFQGALYGLPAEVIKECLLGCLEARFGNLKTPGAMPATVPPANFEEFIYRVWGAGIARHFAIPYNRKLWAVPLDEIETSWLGSRVPLPDIEQIVEGALMPVPRAMGPNARFGYPLRGGFQALMDGFLPLLSCELRTRSRAVGISPSRHCLTVLDLERGGRYEIGFEQLISTLPLPVLVQLMADEAPEAVLTAARRLRHVSVRCVNLGVGREHLTDKHWIYYPEETVFHRIFAQGNASPFCNPPGGFGLTCEISYSDQKPLPAEGDALIDRCLAECREVGLLRPEDPVWAANQLDLPYAYVVYDHHRQEQVAIIRQWLTRHDIVLAGRYAEWEYYNSDHAFIAGRNAADQVLGTWRGQPDESAA